jgi:hypothetical protein
VVLVSVTVLGGLPVVAEVWFSGPNLCGEYDSGCDGLYWQKRDGTRGRELSQQLMERIGKIDPYWESHVTEQANDWLSMNCPTRYADGTVVGEYSEEYFKLNGTR